MSRSHIMPRERAILVRELEKDGKGGAITPLPCPAQPSILREFAQGLRPMRMDGYD